MRLIDADALIKEAYAEGAYGYVDAKQIADAPAVDAMPVRHGQWKLHGNDDDLAASFFCSLCGWNMDENEYLDRWSHLNYCPNCGAKMDEEVNE